MYDSVKNMYTVEVALRKNIWVEGFVKSGHEDGLIVEFDGYPAGNFYYHQLRVPEKSSIVQNIEVGQEIEVPVKIDNCVIGWCKCTVEKIRGEFFSVTGGDGVNPSYTKEEIRTASKSLSMDLKGANKYHFAQIKVPQELKESVVKSENLDKLLDFCKGAISMNYDDTTRNLNIITPNCDDIDNVINLSDFFFKFLKTEQKLNSKLVAVQCRLPYNETHKAGTFIETFHVDKSLMCHVIGTRGFNIEKARKINGIVNIVVDDETSTVKIAGIDSQAVEKARAMMEYVDEMIPVEKYLIPKIIGVKGDNFQKIVDRSFIKRLFVHYVDNEKLYQLHVIGTKKNVESALIMLNFIIRNVKEFEEKMVHLKELRDKCRELNNPGASKSSEGIRSVVDNISECGENADLVNGI